LFIPAFAIASGILTGGSKFLDVIFTIMVYGILNSIPFLDFIGAIKGSGEPRIAHYFLTITIMLVFKIFAVRAKQIRHIL
jgi:hypothetical protein